MLRLNLRFYFYVCVRPFIHCLYFICECKFYARTHVKITRQRKSTLTLILSITETKDATNHMKVTEQYVPMMLLPYITRNFRDIFISRFWCAHISRHLNFTILRKFYILNHFKFAFLSTTIYIS